MRTTFIAISVFAGALFYSQNNLLLLNGAHIKINGGTKASPVQLVINQGNPAGITRNSGHIISEGQYNTLQWRTGASAGNFIFPFGYSTTDYLPFTFNKTTSTAARINASTWATPQNNLPLADTSAVPGVSNMGSVYGGSPNGTVIDRWWDVYSSASFTANYTFTYRGAENTTSNPLGTFFAQQWDGTKWLPGAGSAFGTNTGTGTLSASGISSNGPWVLSSQSNPLPLDLLSFQGTCSSNKSRLDWITASEQNMKDFTIQKSFDAQNFFDVATIPCKNNYPQTNSYHFSDEDEIPAVVFFRLKITELTNDFKYSGIAEIQSCGATEAITGFFNPYNHSLIVKNLPATAGDCALTLFDLSGKTILRQAQVPLNEGRGELILPEIAKGIYLLSVSLPGKEKSVKLFVY
jgi:hypothetical protein